MPRFFKIILLQITIPLMEFKVRIPCELKKRTQLRHVTLSPTHLHRAFNSQLFLLEGPAQCKTNTQTDCQKEMPKAYSVHHTHRAHIFRKSTFAEHVWTESVTPSQNSFKPHAYLFRRSTCTQNKLHCNVSLGKFPATQNVFCLNVFMFLRF